MSFDWTCSFVPAECHLSRCSAFFSGSHQRSIYTRSIMVVYALGAYAPNWVLGLRYEPREIDTILGRQLGVQRPPFQPRKRTRVAHVHTPFSSGAVSFLLFFRFFFYLYCLSGFNLLCFEVQNTFFLSLFQTPCLSLLGVPCHSCLSQLTPFPNEQMLERAEDFKEGVWW